MDFLTADETAQLLRVSPITLRCYIASGRLAAARGGRGVRVRREAIDAFITPVVPAANGSSADWEAHVETLVESLGTSDDETRPHAAGSPFAMSRIGYAVSA
jgi:excisionase family DNA binding protein